MTHTIEVTPEDQMSAVIDFLNRTGNGDMADKVRDLARHRTEAHRALVDAVAELQLAAFLAGRGSIRTKDNGRTVQSLPGPTMDDYRRMARAALSLTKAQP